MKYALALVVFAWLAACGAASSSPTSPTAQQQIPHGKPLNHATTLHDLAWLEGDWHAAAIDTHWRTVAGAMYGIAFGAGGGFEVDIVDDSDDDGKPAPITLVAIGNGRAAMTLALSRVVSDEIDFAGPSASVQIVRRPDDAGWRGTYANPPNAAATFDAARVAPASAPELEAADRAFAADTAASGADGWARAFAPDGAQWEHGARVEGAAIRAGIAQTLAAGQLTWVPVASAAHGNLGVTLGTWTFIVNNAPVAKGSYVTIWAKQPDGSWKVAFDTGRPAS